MATEYDRKQARPYVVLRTGLTPPSSNYSIIRCPFCSTEVQAYWWSIAGVGKRCTGCGALLGSTGQAVPPKISPPKSGHNRTLFLSGRLSRYVDGYFAHHRPQAWRNGWLFQSLLPDNPDPAPDRADATQKQEG